MTYFTDKLGFSSELNSHQSFVRIASLKRNLEPAPRLERHESYATKSELTAIRSYSDLVSLLIQRSKNKYVQRRKTIFQKKKKETVLVSSFGFELQFHPRVIRTGSTSKSTLTR